MTPLVRGIIAVNMVWAFSALVYDWPALREMPVWSWALCAICPIYPVLLAWAWYRQAHRRSADILAFIGVVGSSSFGVLALLFYPMVAGAQGFSWIIVGALAWVLTYAVQGWYLATRIRVGMAVAVGGAGWLIGCLTVQGVTRSYGYLPLADLPYAGLWGLGMVGIVSVILFSWFIWHRSR